MNKQLQQLREKLDALSVRERVIIMLTSLVVDRVCLVDILCRSIARKQGCFRKTE